MFTLNGVIAKLPNALFWADDLITLNTGFSNYNIKILAVASVISLITILIYLPALQNDFVNWDDPLYVYENTDIRSFGINSLKWMFTAFHASNWHPVTWLSHAVDYAIWGLNPMGHHLTSVLIHGLNTFLVVILITRLVYYAGQGRYAVVTPPFPPLAKGGEGGFLREMLGSGNMPLIAGAVTGILFGLHPLHVESVAWVSERKDVLYAFFYMLSILAYMRYVSSPPFNSPLTKGGYRGVRGWHWYSICLLFFILSLMSKPMAVTLPVVLIILDIYPLGRLGFAKERIRKTPSPLPSPARGEGCNISPPLMGGDEGEGGLFSGQRKVLLEKLPFFVLSVVSSVLTVMAQKEGGALVHFKSQLIGERILTATRALMFYLYKMVWPAGLAPYYPIPSDVSIYRMEYTGAFILVLCITVFCIYRWSRQKLWLAVWGYYAVTLFPVLGIIQVGGQSAADRYTYLSSLGLFLLFGLGISFIYERVALIKYRLKVIKTFISIALILIMCILSILTVQQINIWKDSVALWSSEIKRYHDFFMAYRGLGGAYMEKGDYKQAMMNLNKAAELNPGDYLSYLKRGDAYNLMRNYRNAVEDYSRSISLNPRNSTTYYNRGLVFIKLGKHRYAIEDFYKALEINPQEKKVYYNLGVLYDSHFHNYQDAIKYYSKAIEIDPDYAKAYNNRGVAYAETGNHRKAIEDFNTAIKIDNGDSTTYYNRGYAYMALGDRTSANRDFLHAAKLSGREESSKRIEK